MRKFFAFLISTLVIAACTPPDFDDGLNNDSEENVNSTEGTESSDDTNVPKNMIYYTTTDGEILTPNEVDSYTFGATLISNTYEDGKGILTFDNDVTSIGDNAFRDCTGLTSITIPNSVTSIGESAFGRCTGLKEVHINDLTAWCSIDFESYDANPLYYAHNLYLNNELVTELVIPDGVTSIGSGAFYDCPGLKSITIPNSVTSIGDYAFYECSGLTSITIPNSVTSIGNSAFSRCSGLESIVVDPGNTKYDSRENCNAIIETESNTLITGCKNTVIPNSVTSIGDYAFDGCSGLTSVTIPNSVTSIGDDAFAWCYGLTSITIPNSVTSIGDCAFCACSRLTCITIPNSVTSIGENAFYGCSGLTSITIPNSVTSIGDYAFMYCDDLTSITIPNSVTSIGKEAFRNCSGLTSIEIPNSVTSIGDDAFYACRSLKEVHITDLDAWKNIGFGEGGNPLYYGAKLYLNGVEVTDY